MINHPGYVVFYFNLLQCSFIHSQGVGGVGPHVGWGEKQAGNKILRQRNKHIWNVITERDAETDVSVFSSKYQVSWCIGWQWKIPKPKLGHRGSTSRSSHNKPLAF